MAPGAGRGKSIALLALAVSLACLALLVLLGRPGPTPNEAPRPGEPERPRAVAAADTAGAEPPAEERAREVPAREGTAEGGAVPPPAPRVEVAPEEPADGESAPSVPSGIGLFPPPGTDPIKVGIVVPDDYELPEGYLRHYQVTDDGQQLEPILLFHPDYELLDDAGQPVPLPVDRVVPPELAPPGLPIRMVEIPPPREETGP